MRKNFNIIQYLKSDKGLTGAFIANKLEVSRGYVSNLANGKPIGIQMANRIAEAFGLSIGFILTGEDAKEHEGIAVNNEVAYLQKQLEDKNEIIELLRDKIKRLEQENESLKESNGFSKGKRAV